MGEKIDANIQVKKKVSLKKELLSLFLLTVSAAIYAFNLKSFIRAGSLVPGGFSGLAVLIQTVFKRFLSVELPYSLIYLPLNAIPAYICLISVGKRFTLYSIYHIVVSSLLTDIIPKVPITSDILLICVFGGIIGGASLGIVVRQGACSGGTDFIVIAAAEKKGVNMWNYALAFNVCLLIAAGILGGAESALYSIIYQFVSTQVVRTMDKRFNRDTMLIITGKPEEVTTIINNATKHSSTVIDGTGSYTGEEKKIIYSVVDHGQVPMITNLIKEVDPKAFINVLKTEQVKGNFHVEPR